MNLLETYCDCVRQGDVEGMTSLFTDDAKFYDGGFAKQGQPPVRLQGKDALRAFFKEIP